MSVVESYLFLFFDSILDALVLVPNSTMVYKVMLIFGNYNLPLMFGISIVGSVIGASLNYLLGMVLITVKKTKFGNSVKFERLMKFSQKKLYWLSFFSFVPVFGILLTTCSGLMKISYKRFFAYTLLGRAVYYLLLAFL